ncbi:hypothetical protein C490_17052 [Natronobacterium gregoryi SP2]|uniref:CARDB domain-containing protein n=1 Tax=Natronobacterium gregoryi (strain ATCC 43098 / DSM 3393 / CCM 3738 / CIP 104747 / IAM 13177 / JCM 8860 / NBRC 102187 / NCIMB 2189 / SP2) TaxID=797304 RepID=L9XLS6_NATGS|nr:hypothetical protein C490_17052 [Natronobacterium gregoryi SP2]
MEAIEHELSRRVRGVLGEQEESEITVRILETNAPVRGGSLLDVPIEVENEGNEPVRVAVHVEYDGENRWTVETPVAAGEVETLEYVSVRTAPMETDGEATVRVEADGSIDEQTVAVLAVPELDSDRTSPDRALSIQPDTSLLFEVAGVGEHGGRTQWFVDGEHAGQSMGPWYSAYYDHRGADFWLTTLEETGTREVAAVVGRDDRSRATWTVDVTEGGVAAPTIEAARPADESLGVVEGEPIELELDVAHPGGTLDRVVWWLGHADVVLEVTSVSGAEETVTLELERYCHGCPIVVWVVGENGTVTVESPWVLDEVGDAPDAEPQVALTGTNDPVDAGGVLEVTAELENLTDDEVLREVELIVGHDPELVDSRSVTVGPDAAETVALEFETAEVGRTQTFPVRVETEESVDERTVMVIGTEDVGPDVTIIETNSPVRTGEFLEVAAEVENRRDSAFSREVQLVVGHDPDVVDTRALKLESGESETVTVGYETAVVERDQEFPVRVETEGDADEVPVFVYVDEPPMLVSIVETNAPVATGDVLEVTAELENTGDAEVSQDVDLVVGHDPQRVDSDSVTVGAGESETVAFEFETAVVRHTQTFPARVEGETDADVRAVEVIGTEALDVSVTITETNDPVDAGELLEVTAAVENEGESAIEREFELLVGHDPTVEDSAVVRLDPGERETIELGFETAVVERDQEFPVRVESATVADERTVTVRGTGDEDDEEVEFEFVDCTTAEASGVFGEGDDLTVETLFVDSAGPGNAHFSVAFGDDLEASFSGTVRFQVADVLETTVVAETDDEIVVELPDEGFGSTIHLVAVNWTGPDESTESNPEDCVDERRPERPTIALEAVTLEEDDGEYGTHAVTFDYENPNDLPLSGGEFVSGMTPDEPADLEPGTDSFTVEWTPESPAERLVWEVDLGDYHYDETRRAETEPAEAYAPADPEFAVSILEATDPVAVGDALVVTVAVENVGDAAGTGEIELEVGGRIADAATVDLDGGADDTLTLTAQPRPDEVGVLEVVVRSGDDEATAEVTVEDAPEPAFFEVVVVQATDVVAVGDSIEVTAEIENVGDDPGEGLAELTLERRGTVDATWLSLEGSDAETVVLSSPATPADAGDRTVTVSTDDDSDSVQVTVDELDLPEEPGEEDDTVGEEPEPDDPPEETPDEQPPDPPDDPGDEVEDDPGDEDDEGDDGTGAETEDETTGRR